VERHPLLPQWDLLEYCASERIAIQAHTPLGGGGFGGKKLRAHATVLRVASEAGMTPAQVRFAPSQLCLLAPTPTCPVCEDSLTFHSLT
jgi:diketogulonate reductase-like aldo/keto reductase